MLRRAAGRKTEPSAVIHDSRTLRATPESGERAGDDGAKRKQSLKLHMAVDRLGHFLALHVAPANANDRAQVEHLARAVQAATDDSVEIAFVDQGYAGGKPATAARVKGGQYQRFSPPPPRTEALSPSPIRSGRVRY
ncbi:Transposase IS4 family protein [Methylorubrum extorquens]